ncbi:hypothetical protein JXA56_02605 [Candidatus Micrarchaeota archaeon]|nr:hypothetical protein [Candidatus Micrarchaeota archaeon]
MRLKHRSHERNHDFAKVKGLIEKAALPAAIFAAVACGSGNNSESGAAEAGSAGVVQPGGSGGQAAGGSSSGGLQTGGTQNTGGNQAAGSSGAGTGGTAQASICGIYDDDHEYDFMLGEGRRPDCGEYVFTFIMITGDTGKAVFSILNSTSPTNVNYIELGEGESTTYEVRDVGTTRFELCSKTSEPCTFIFNSEPIGDPDCRVVMASDRQLGTRYSCE